jgi:hypothetical protein
MFPGENKQKTPKEGRHDIQNNDARHNMLNCDCQLNIIKCYAMPKMSKRDEIGQARPLFFITH